jgi:hypothetical protein
VGNGNGALAGVRVIDLASVVMGPYAAQLLGDMGADVIKVEPPAGDLTRITHPQRHPGMGALALNVNRNKRSVVLDLKSEDGQEVSSCRSPRCANAGSPQGRRCRHVEFTSSRPRRVSKVWVAVAKSRRGGDR